MEEKEIHVWSVLASIDLAKVLIHDGYYFSYNPNSGMFLFEAFEDYIEQLRERMRNANYKIPNFFKNDF